MNKKISLWLVLLLLWFSLIITILFGWAVWHIEKNGPLFRGKAGKIVISIASFPSLVQETFGQLNSPNPLIGPVIYPHVDGFKMEKDYVDSNYILLTTYGKKENQSIVRLMRISDQKTLYEWKPDFEELKRKIGKQNKTWQHANIHSIEIVHPLLSSDGSLIFHGLNSSLIKINKDSKLLWAMSGDFSHSVECDSEGNIWSPYVIENSRFLPNFLDNYIDDAIAKVSPAGKLLFQKSVAEILVENGYRGLLLGTARYEHDLVHLNDIQPALTTTRYWRKDDLLISLRHKSTVFLYRPSTNKILWLKIGPWLSQHDVDFIDSTSIGVFGNNVVRDNSKYIIDGHNEQYIFNFKTQQITTPYTEFLKKAKVSTVTDGRSDVLSNGDLFVEETTNNRLLRGSSNDIIWQYVNRIDTKSVGALTWSRFITKEEYKKLKFLQ
jgi:hypothetical protein